MGRTRYTINSRGKHVGTRTYKDFGNTHYTGRKYFYGATDSEVDAKIAAFEAEQNREEAARGKLFQDVADAWRESKWDEISINTQKGYKVGYDRACEYFGETPIGDITARDIILYLRKYAAMSQKSISNLRLCVKEIFDVALTNGDVEINPAVSLPIVRGKPSVARLPATDKDISIINALKTASLMGRYYYTILHTGLRKSEAIGLKEKDIDRKNRTLTVNRSIVYQYRKPIEKLPKTEAGVRTIILTDSVLEVLPKVKRNQYVFFPEGIPNETAIEKMIKRFQTDNGLTCTPHQLRHSYASMLNDIGLSDIDKIHLMGHTDISMTDSYTHMTEYHMDELRNAIEEHEKNLLERADKADLSVS